MLDCLTALYFSEIRKKIWSFKHFFYFFHIFLCFLMILAPNAPPKIDVKCQKPPKIFPMALNHIPKSPSKGYQQKNHQRVNVFLIFKKYIVKLVHF